MPLTIQQANELELLRLKRRKLEIESGLEEKSQFPVARAAEVQAIEQAGLTDPSVITTPRPEEDGRPFPIGAAIGGTVGGIVGGIPGAGLGAAGGEAAEQLVRRGIGADVPKTSQEAATRIGLEGALGLVGEAGGRILLGGAAKVFNKFSKKVPVEARQAIDFLEANMPSTQRGRFNPLRYIYGKNKAKLALLPAEATDDRLLDILHNVSEASLVGGGRIQDFKLRRTRFLQDFADDMIASFGEISTADDVGRIFLDTLEEKIAPSRVAASTLYNTADDLTRGRVVRDPVTLIERTVDAAKISTKQLKDFARGLTPTVSAAKGIGAAESGDSLVKSILSLNDDVSFTVAKNLRSRLRAVADGFSVTNKKAPALGLAKKFGGMIDDATEVGLKAHNPQALNAWREGNRIYREGIEEFDNIFLRRLVRSADPDISGKFPETIVNGVFKKGNVSGVKVAQRALGGIDSSPWRKMQSWHIRDLFKKGTNQTTGELSGTLLEGVMFGKSGIGEKTMRAIYTPKQLNSLKQFANALKVIQTKQAEGTGRMFIQLTQAGALLSLPFASGGQRKTAAVIILGPAVLARGMTNPAVARILIEGVKAGVKSKVAAGALGRFVTDITNLEIERGRREDQLETP